MNKTISLECNLILKSSESIHPLGVVKIELSEHDSGQERLKKSLFLFLNQPFVQEILFSERNLPLMQLKLIGSSSNADFSVEFEERVVVDGLVPFDLSYMRAGQNPEMTKNLQLFLDDNERKRHKQISSLLNSKLFAQFSGFSSLLIDGVSLNYQSIRILIVKD